MVILTLNCGSSSVKYQVYNWERHEVMGKGMVERIGLPGARIENSSLNAADFEQERECNNHTTAIQWILDTILDSTHGCIPSLDQIKAIGHRVVHGGEVFKKSVIINDDVIATFEKIQGLAPLHVPANIMGIKAAQAVLPNITHCAIMDTAWHQTMDAQSFMYALPYEWYEKFNIRRYGFHGTSFLYTAKRAAVLLGKKPSETNLIIAHIGNGASICAVKNGVGYDTSMGLTPLEGLVMGTRCGDIDPAIIPFVMDKANLSAKDVDSILNKKSGILGITEKFSDRRDVQKGVDENDSRCILAQDMEAYRIKKYIGAYSAILGRVDAVIFTAGVGEMNPNIREKALSDLENIGISLDKEKNNLSRVRCSETVISTDDSKVKIFVIPTDEELVMTEDTYALLNDSYDVHTNFEYTFQKKEYVNKERQPKLEKLLKEDPSIKKILP